MIQGESFDITFVAYLHEDISACEEICSMGRVHALRKWQKKWLLKPEREYYVHMLKSYGYKGDTPPFHANIKRPEKVPPPAVFRICIAPCGKNEHMWRYKKWPYYPALISGLRDRYPDLQICIVGTKDDEIGIEFDGENFIDCRSIYSLSETAWLLKHSDLAIGNDCGPMHIASAVNTSSIVIFGPTCIIKNNYSGKTVMLYPKNIKCWPCQYNVAHIDNCNTGQCISNTKPEMVLERLEFFFDKGE
jgi:ADP-heptose:LPS heptosyltransferase